MKKIEKAWENGVKIIFTTQLPQQVADGNGSDSDIIAIVNRMLVSERSKGCAVFIKIQMMKLSVIFLRQQNLM